MEQRLYRNSTLVEERAFVPYQNDNYTPQGVASGYDESGHLVYISLYHRTIDGNTGGNNSIIVELDAQRNLRVRRCFRLKGRLKTSHVGGIAYFERGGVRYVFFCTSAGNNESKIYRLEQKRLSQFWVPKEDTVFTIPAGGEGLSFSPDGKLWTVSESGAKYYQKRSSNPWTTFYPFVFSIPQAVIFRGAAEPVVRSEQKDISRSYVEIKCYPCPANSEVRIEYSLAQAAHIKMTIYDCLGRKVEDLVQGYTPTGHHSLIWHPEFVASGIYFFRISSVHENMVRRIAILK